MGEVADMMLDGELCAGCGVFIDEEGAAGFPRYCSPECAANCGERYRCEQTSPRPAGTPPGQRRMQRQNRDGRTWDEFPTIKSVGEAA